MYLHLLKLSLPSSARKRDESKVTARYCTDIVDKQLFNNTRFNCKILLCAKAKFTKIANTDYHCGMYPTMRQKHSPSSLVVTMSAHSFNELSFTLMNRVESIADRIK